MNIPQIIFNGLVSGMIVALPAMALSLMFGILRFPNFAIGSMLTVGAYGAYAANAMLGLPLLAAALVSVLISAMVAVGSDHLVFRPLRERSSITLLVASIGLAFVLENLIRLGFGNDVRGFDIAVARPIRFGGLRINHEQITAMATVLGSMLLVHVVLVRTRLGRAMRAVADNPMLAAVRGIEREHILKATWALAGTLTAIAGVLIGLDTAIEPTLGWNKIVVVFAAALLGGIGSPMGAVLGALLLGLAEEISTLFIPSHYRSIVAFLIMVAILLARPWGLVGRRSIAK